MFHRTTIQMLVSVAFLLFAPILSATDMSTEVEGDQTVQGKLGVGTSSPAAKVTINDADHNAGNINIGTVQVGSLWWNAIWLNGLTGSTDYNILSDATNKHLVLNRPSSGDMYFRKDNETQMVLKASGNAGIGTTAPSDRVHLSGASVGTGDGVTALRIDQPADSVGANARILSGVVSGAAPYFAVETRSSSSPYNILERLRIDGEGKVGIGTTAPVGLLHLSSASNAYQYVQDTTNNVKALLAADDAYGIVGTASNHPLRLFVNNTYKAQLDSSGVFSVYSGSYYLGIKHTGTDGYVTTSSGDLVLQPATAYVGINNTSPAEALDVTGSIKTSSNLTLGSTGLLKQGSTTRLDGSGNGIFANLTASGNVCVGSSSSVAPLTFGASTGDKVSLAGSSGSYYGIGVQTNETQFYMPSSAHFSFNKGGAYQTSGSNEIMRITGDGKVCIGATSPDSAAVLDMRGPLIVQNAGASNYAWGKVYKFSNDEDYPVFALGKSYGSSFGSYSAVSDGKHLAMLRFDGSNGSDMAQAAKIRVLVDGTPGSTYVPSRLMLDTATNSAAPATRMTIKSSGNVGIGLTDPQYPLHVAGEIYATGIVSGSDIEDRSSRDFKRNIRPVPASGAYLLSPGLTRGWRTGAWDLLDRLTVVDYELRKCEKRWRMPDGRIVKSYDEATSTVVCNREGQPVTEILQPDELGAKEFFEWTDEGSGEVHRGFIAEDVPDEFTRDHKSVSVSDMTANNTAALKEAKRRILELEKNGGEAANARLTTLEDARTSLTQQVQELVASAIRAEDLQPGTKANDALVAQITDSVLRQLGVDPWVEITMAEAWEEVEETTVQEVVKTVTKYRPNWETMVTESYTVEEKVTEKTPTGRKIKQLKVDVRFDENTGKYYRRIAIDFATQQSLNAAAREVSKQSLLSRLLSTAKVGPIAKPVLVKSEAR
jgi:hypothetical protein